MPIPYLPLDVTLFLIQTLFALAPNLTISELRDIFQILFFTVVGVVTVLTYLGARRTLLQPLRTEVFKEQLKLLTDISSLFVGKEHIDLEELHDFDRIIRANSQKIIDDFADIYGGITYERRNRLYESPEFVYQRWFFNPTDPFWSKTYEDSTELSPKEKWANYRVHSIFVSEKYDAASKALTRFSSSPVVPSDISELLQDYEHIVDGHLRAIKETLAVRAELLVQKYLETGKYGACHRWIVEECKANLPTHALHQKATEITRAIRAYYGPDNIMK